KDTSLWKKDPKHQAIISNALGWLSVPGLMAERAADLRTFADEVGMAGVRDVVLLGMGGSSLCPELFARTFPPAPGFPKLHVLDSTVPDAIMAVQRNIDLGHTLFIVSSKSGGTIETLSHYAAFYDQVKSHSGNPPGAHFVAITDPGTKLETIGKEKQFRRIFLNPPDIGGRYSALSYFGLVPAALIGMDVAKLLDRAIRMAHSSAGCIRVDDNLGVSLGAALGALQKTGRDKLGFVVSPPIAAYGLWVEQLIAESTGKEGTGIVPICDEPIADPRYYGKDRIFAYLRLDEGASAEQDAGFEAIRKAGIPAVKIAVADKIDLGEEFMRWEIATATAGAILGIDAFDQPNVQESKDNTGRLLAEFQKTGKLPSVEPIAKQGALTIYSGGATAQALKGQSDFRAFLRAFFGLVRPGDYFATMAYVAPSPAVDKEIAALRQAIMERFDIATTFGYGPRFLHSTGQLHKGGPNTGLYLQITQDHRESIPIPGAPYDFSLLNQAQSMGDFQSLEAHGRRVIRVHLSGADPIAALEALRKEIVTAIAK
ncbi:MAG TPA: hypothetical protein VMT58_04555, partial [Candidatus Binataceae bacterium]|nr:hypothetical protein [Candidatus Binataceae bacterium]